MDSPCTLRDSPTARAYPRYHSTKYRSPEHQQNRPTHPTASYAPNTQPSHADRTRLTNRAILFPSSKRHQPQLHPDRMQKPTTTKSPPPPRGNRAKYETTQAVTSASTMPPPSKTPSNATTFPRRNAAPQLPNRPAAKTDPFPINQRVGPINQTVAPATAPHTCKDGPIDPRAVDAGIGARHPSISTCATGSTGFGSRPYFTETQSVTGSEGHISRLCERFVRDGRPGLYRQNLWYSGG